jgi:hypothetical protein
MDPSLASSFQKTNDGYVYLGNSMADLVNAINENTEVTRIKNEKNLTEQINAAEVIGAM